MQAACSAVADLPQFAWMHRDLLLEQTSLRKDLAGDQRPIGQRLDAARREVVRQQKSLLLADERVQAAEAKLCKAREQRESTSLKVDAATQRLKQLELQITADEHQDIANAVRILASTLEQQQLPPIARTALDLICQSVRVSVIAN